MQTRALTFAVAVLLAVPAATLAATYNRSTVSTSARVSAFGVEFATGAVCDDALGQQLAFLECGTGGVAGATIVLDGSDGGVDLNVNGAGSASPAGNQIFATGSCTVDMVSGSAGASSFSFVCGVDRDDDGAVSNVGLSGGNDNFVSASGSSAQSLTATFCFHADFARSRDMGPEWDDLEVFMSSDLGGADLADVAFDVSVSITTSSTPCVASGTSSSEFGGDPDRDSIAGGCWEMYVDGVFHREPCPPDLCGLPEGFVTVSGRGPAGGAAPVGTMDCHDTGHQVTGTIATQPGSFNGAGAWGEAMLGPIVSGTHPHCYLSSIGDAKYAFVQCGKA